MDNGEKIYEGKAKILYKGDNSKEIIQYFKDDATAFNNIKKSSIEGKGIINNYISEYIMKLLKKHDIPVHFVERIDQRRQKILKLDIIPLEVIVRNFSAGSICKKLAIEEGKKFNKPIIEFCYKDDSLGDPLIIEQYIYDVLQVANKEQVEKIKEITYQINKILIKTFQEINIHLIDFKIEFGIDAEGKILLAHEISPDSCRLWDIETLEKMDKDRFRLDLGSLVEYYLQIANRLKINIPNI